MHRCCVLGTQPPEWGSLCSWRGAEIHVPCKEPVDSQNSEGKWVLGEVVREAKEQSVSQAGRARPPLW